MVPSRQNIVSTKLINFKRGVLEEDSLSSQLFCFSLLLISIQLRRSSGYMADPPGRRKHKITQLFYEDT